MAVLLAAAMLLVSQVGDPFGPEVDPPSTDVDVEAPETPLSPHAYLYATYPSLARRLDCMIQRESSWDRYARGYKGWYVGLAQFDLPTWMETPPGQAGLSRTDPYASIDAMAWGVSHLGYGRWPVTSRRC